MFMHVLPRLAVCFLSLMAVPAATGRTASDTVGLTLPAAQARVAQRNASLQALAHEVAAQAGLVRQAGVLPNPELSGLIEDRQSATRTTTIQLTQPIELGGKRGSRISAAEAERDLSRAVLHARRAELRAATSTAFYSLLGAQARLELANATVALARQALDVAAGRVAAGKNSPVDQTRARIAMSGADIELAQAHADVETARELLAGLWGGSADEINRIGGRLDHTPDLAPLPVLLARLDQSPGIARARVELQRRIALVRVETARRAPDLGLTVGSKNDVQLGRRQAIFGVSLPLPLFDRNQGRIEETAQRTEQARADLSLATASLASDLRIAHRRLTLARHQARTLQADHLPAAHSAYEAARKGYEYGKFGILDVIDAQRVLLHAQAQHLRVLADAHGAAADIERILGAPGTVQSQETP